MRRRGRGVLARASTRVVQHCLEKNPDERFQTARDVAFALEALSGAADVDEPRIGGRAAAPAGARRGCAAIIAAVVALAAAAAAFYAGRSTRAGRAARRLHAAHLPPADDIPRAVRARRQDRRLQRAR